MRHARSFSPPPQRSTVTPNTSPSTCRSHSRPRVVLRADRSALASGHHGENGTSLGTGPLPPYAYDTRGHRPESCGQVYSARDCRHCSGSHRGSPDRHVACRALRPVPLMYPQRTRSTARRSFGDRSMESGSYYDNNLSCDPATSEHSESLKERPSPCSSVSTSSLGRIHKTGSPGVNPVLRHGRRGRIQTPPYRREEYIIDDRHQTEQSPIRNIARAQAGDSLPSQRRYEEGESGKGRPHTHTCHRRRYTYDGTYSNNAASDSQGCQEEAGGDRGADTAAHCSRHGGLFGSSGISAGEEGKNPPSSLDNSGRTEKPLTRLPPPRSVCHDAVAMADGAWKDDVPSWSSEDQAVDHGPSEGSLTFSKRASLYGNPSFGHGVGNHSDRGDKEISGDAWHLEHYCRHHGNRRRYLQSHTDTTLQQLNTSQSDAIKSLFVDNEQREDFDRELLLMEGEKKSKDERDGHCKNNNGAEYSDSDPEDELYQELANHPKPHFVSTPTSERGIIDTVSDGSSPGDLSDVLELVGDYSPCWNESQHISPERYVASLEDGERNSDSDSRTQNKSLGQEKFPELWYPSKRYHQTGDCEEEDTTGTNLLLYDKSSDQRISDHNLGYGNGHVGNDMDTDVGALDDRSDVHRMEELSEKHVEDEGDNFPMLNRSRNNSAKRGSAAPKNLSPSDRSRVEQQNASRAELHATSRSSMKSHSRSRNEDASRPVENRDLIRDVNKNDSRSRSSYLLNKSQESGGKFPHGIDHRWEDRHRDGRNNESIPDLGKKHGSSGRASKKAYSRSGNDMAFFGQSRHSSEKLASEKRSAVRNPEQLSYLNPSIGSSNERAVQRHPDDRPVVADHGKSKDHSSCDGGSHSKIGGGDQPSYERATSSEWEHRQRRSMSAEWYQDKPEGGRKPSGVRGHSEDRGQRRGVDGNQHTASRHSDVTEQTKLAERSHSRVVERSHSKLTKRGHGDKEHSQRHSVSHSHDRLDRTAGQNATEQSPGLYNIDGRDIFTNFGREIADRRGSFNSRSPSQDIGRRHSQTIYHGDHVIKDPRYVARETSHIERQRMRSGSGGKGDGSNRPYSGTRPGDTREYDLLKTGIKGLIVTNAPRISPSQDIGRRHSQTIYHGDHIIKDPRYVARETSHIERQRMRSGRGGKGDGSNRPYSGTRPGDTREYEGSRVPEKNYNPSQPLDESSFHVGHLFEKQSPQGTCLLDKTADSSRVLDTSTRTAYGVNKSSYHPGQLYDKASYQTGLIVTDAPRISPSSKRDANTSLDHSQQQVVDRSSVGQSSRDQSQPKARDYVSANHSRHFSGSRTSFTTDDRATQNTFDHSVKGRPVFRDKPRDFSRRHSVSSFQSSEQHDLRRERDSEIRSDIIQLKRFLESIRFSEAGYPNGRRQDSGFHRSDVGLSGTGTGTVSRMLHNKSTQCGSSQHSFPAPRGDNPDDSRLLESSSHGSPVHNKSSYHIGKLYERFSTHNVRQAGRDCGGPPSKTGALPSGRQVSHGSQGTPARSEEVSLLHDSHLASHQHDESSYHLGRLLEESGADSANTHSKEASRLLDTTYSAGNLPEASKTQTTQVSHASLQHNEKLVEGSRVPEKNYNPSQPLDESSFHVGHLFEKQSPQDTRLLDKTADTSRVLDTSTRTAYGLNESSYHPGQLYDKASYESSVKQDGSSRASNPVQSASYTASSQLQESTRVVSHVPMEGSKYRLGKLQDMTSYQSTPRPVDSTRQDSRLFYDDSCYASQLLVESSAPPNESNAQSDRWYLRPSKLTESYQRNGEKQRVDLRRVDNSESNLKEPSGDGPHQSPNHRPAKSGSYDKQDQIPGESPRSKTAKTRRIPIGRERKRHGDEESSVVKLIPMEEISTTSNRRSFGRRRRKSINKWINFLESLDAGCDFQSCYNNSVASADRGMGDSGTQDARKIQHRKRRICCVKNCFEPTCDSEASCENEAQGQADGGVDKGDVNAAEKVGEETKSKIAPGPVCEMVGCFDGPVLRDDNTCYYDNESTNNDALSAKRTSVADSIRSPLPYPAPPSTSSSSSSSSLPSLISSSLESVRATVAAVPQGMSRYLVLLGNRARRVWNSLPALWDVTLVLFLAAVFSGLTYMLYYDTEALENMTHIFDRISIFSSGIHQRRTPPV